MSPVYDERTFEDHIVASMTGRGWTQGDNSGYRRELGLDTAQLFTFLGATQIDTFNELVARCGGSQDQAQATFAKTLAKRVDTEGTLHVLRKGATVEGLKFDLAYFKPSHTIAEGALDDYERNRLTVTRQLRYAAKDDDQGNALDLVLFVNGLPVATAELKNPLTGQNVNHAKHQYARDRDPRELLFAKRALVHFAVDPDLVFLTTRLAGKDTRFLPFNTGSNGAGRTGGAGNPLPASDSSGYRTAYLWEQVWDVDNWMDLLERFVHVKRDKDGKGRRRDTVVFPRYHQWHAVRRMVDHASRHGAGNNYLVMHSAGSGKSNTIAWLAHRLSSLHTPADRALMDPAAADAGLEPNTPVFDKTVIITDRSVLDKQLKDTVGDFSQVAGLVRWVGGKGGSKSAQLAEALATSSERIVVVTLQTFPALLDYLKREPTEIRGGRFAIVVDEAHSSQSGEAAKDVKKALRELGLDTDDDGEDTDDAENTGGTGATSVLGPESTEEALLKSAAYRGRSANLSYFAFTATPKHKTLNLFGVRNEATGDFEPFHTYSMRQAIEEGFILDPLRSYITYATQYRLLNGNTEDSEVDAGKAKSQLARFALLHDSTLAQHAEIIVENFNAVTRKQMGGRAKAMVVTSSRAAALRMYLAVKSYLADSGAPDPGALVAFSGSLTHPISGEDVTESSLNGFPEAELPKRFGYTRADDANAAARGAQEYRLLIVADKYQTGFDQPLLTTMFVEKSLKGVAAVQTLSRLNRTHPLKSQSDLRVLDFANDAEEIRQSFLPYYERAVTSEADPDILHTIQYRVMHDVDVVHEPDLQGFAEAFHGLDAGIGDEAVRNHPELNRFIASAVDRYAALLDSEEEDDRDGADRFRADLNDYVTKYAFLSQVMRYPDAALERLYLYGRFLLRRLPARTDGGVDIGEVDLSHLKMFRTGEHDLKLSPEGDQELPGFSDGAGGAYDPKKELLSELIELFNEHFGHDLNEADRLMMEERFQTVVDNPDVEMAAVRNDEEAFRHAFEPAMKDAVMDRYESGVEFTERYIGEPDFQSSINRAMSRAAYRLLRQRNGLSTV
ncbi:type I restriction endonuclease [Nocardiopsis sp. CT-R113]|uniref:Type I restriction endonuclease n=1 Tax=Nocardiopsis codii TaxID=3065942 RepID=A0ABU7K944_9ACTN|nr:type I restriction endonuclease [Nocardiopsis sp. CT-R113]MEE2038758.1 type I restriction endonuclease [Nocardiopsis sp. CT-R113]